MTQQKGATWALQMICQRVPRAWSPLLRKCLWSHQRLVGLIVETTLKSSTASNWLRITYCDSNTTPKTGVYKTKTPIFLSYHPEKPWNAAKHNPRAKGTIWPWNILGLPQIYKTKTPKDSDVRNGRSCARNLHFGNRKHQKDAYLGKRSGSSPNLQNEDPLRNVSRRSYKASMHALEGSLARIWVIIWFGGWGTGDLGWGGCMWSFPGAAFWGSFNEQSQLTKDICLFA